MPRIISVYCYTWDYRHVPSYLGLQACTLTPGITGVDLAPGITGVDPHAKDYRCILLHLGLLACTLISGIKCMSPHTWDCRQASSHLEFQVCTLSHLGLQGCTLTPGIAGVDPYTWLPWHFFFSFEEHVGDSCSDHGSPPSSRSHLHCSRSTGLDFLADLLPFVTSLPFYKASHTCFLQAQLRGCRKLYENKSILYSKHAWCPCQASSFPGCRHQRSYASFLSRAGLCCPHLLSDIH